MKENELRKEWVPIFNHTFHNKTINGMKIDRVTSFLSSKGCSELIT